MPAGRPRKQVESALLNEIEKEKELPPKEMSIEEMPLNKLGDYIRYNIKAREINHRVGILRYPVKQCPVELHPHQRVIFNRKDQPRNPLPVFLWNEMIKFKKLLVPSRTYDLPLCIIDYLSSKGTAIWEWIENPDGSRQTAKVGTDPRFAIRTVYQDRSEIAA